jgi:hypothetical protein
VLPSNEDASLDERKRAFIELSPHLSEDLLEIVLSKIPLLESLDAQAAVFRNIAPHLNETQLHVALVIAETITDDAHDFGIYVGGYWRAVDRATVNFNLGSQRYQVCVGLTDVAETKLGEAVYALAQVRQQQPAY